MTECKLKPCPFCGGKAEIKQHVEIDGNVKYLSKNVVCTKCFAQTQKETCNGYYGLYFTDEQAAEKWNTRKPIDEIVERLKSELKKAYEECFDYPHILEEAIKILKGEDNERK